MEPADSVGACDSTQWILGKFAGVFRAAGLVFAFGHYMGGKCDGFRASKWAGEGSARPSDRISRVGIVVDSSADMANWIFCDRGLGETAGCGIHGADFRYAVAGVCGLVPWKSNWTPGGRRRAAHAQRTRAIAIHGFDREGKIIAACFQEVADEPVELSEGGEAFLEIHSSRAKAEWIPPKTVRIGDVYFRLEQLAQGNVPRPFIFRLRRLAAGAPGRTVIGYESRTAI